jgi:hypothetical protein
MNKLLYYICATSNIGVGTSVTSHDEVGSLLLASDHQSWNEYGRTKGYW